MGSGFATPLVHTCMSPRATVDRVSLDLEHDSQDAGSDGQCTCYNTLNHIKGFVVYRGSPAQIKEVTTVEFQQIT